MNFQRFIKHQFSSIHKVIIASILSETGIQVVKFHNRMVSIFTYSAFIHTLIIYEYIPVLIVTTCKARYMYLRTRYHCVRANNGARCTLYVYESCVAGYFIVIMNDICHMHSRFSDMR